MDLPMYFSRMLRKNVQSRSDAYLSQWLHDERARRGLFARTLPALLVSSSPSLPVLERDGSRWLPGVRSLEMKLQHRFRCPFPRLFRRCVPCQTYSGTHWFRCDPITCALVPCHIAPVGDACSIAFRLQRFHPRHSHPSSCLVVLLRTFQASCTCACLPVGWLVSSPGH